MTRTTPAIVQVALRRPGSRPAAANAATGMVATANTPSTMGSMSRRPAPAPPLRPPRTPAPASTTVVQARLMKKSWLGCRRATSRKAAQAVERSPSASPSSAAKRWRSLPGPGGGRPPVEGGGGRGQGGRVELADAGEDARDLRLDDPVVHARALAPSLDHAVGAQDAELLTDHGLAHAGGFLQLGHVPLGVLEGLEEAQPQRMAQHADNACGALQDGRIDGRTG